MYRLRAFKMREAFPFPIEEPCEVAIEALTRRSRSSEYASASRVGKSVGAVHPSKSGAS